MLLNHLFATKYTQLEGLSFLPPKSLTQGPFARELSAFLAALWKDMGRKGGGDAGRKG